MKTRTQIVLGVAVALGLAGCDPDLLPPVGTTSAGIHVPVMDSTGTADVSASMAQFLASVPDGATIEFARDGRYRMEDTFVLDGRNDLTIRGNDAEFVATSTGEMMRASVRIQDSTNISIEDLRVVGANPYAGAKDGIYRAEQGGQHGFDIDSSTAVDLLGVHVTDVYGDFVYVGARDGRPPSEQIVVRDGTFLRSGRQGITVTRGHDILVEHSTLTETKRSSFDFEPGRGAESTVADVVIRDNEVIDGRLLFVAAAGHGPVDDVTIENNTLTGMPMNIVVGDLDGGVRRNWRIVGNVGDLRSGNPHAATMRITGLDGLVVRGNHQVMKPDRDMVGVGAVDSCGLDVQDNHFPNSVGQLRVTGAC